MSFSRLGGLLFLSVGTLAAIAAPSACSSDDKPSAASDASADVAAEANLPAPSEGDAGEPKTCRQRCEDQHPNGISKDQAINSCWQTSCNAPCIQEEEPSSDAGAEGGSPDAGGVDGGGTCVSPVVTISPGCDHCTIQFCCAAWDGCFQDAECSALEACYSQCED